MKCLLGIIPSYGAYYDSNSTDHGSGSGGGRGGQGVRKRTKVHVTPPITHPLVTLLESAPYSGMHY